MVAARVPHRVRLAYSAAKKSYDPAWAETYGPRPGRKSPRDMVADNVRWAVERGEVNPYYFAYGMDAEGGPGPEHFLTVREQMTLIRDQIYEDDARDFAGIMRDKYLFALVAQALGHRSPRCLAFLELDRVEWLDPRRVAPYDTFVEDAEGVDGFVKPIHGRQASGTFTLRVEGGRLTVDGNPARPDDVAGRLSGRVLLQERIRQHPAVSAIYPHAINTVRFVTTLRDGTATPLAAALRVGVDGRSVDNWSAGGLVVSVDLETGRLRGRGLFKPGYPGEAAHGGSVARHPDTGVLLDGQALPDFEAVVDLACRFHQDLGRLRSVGWDVAITPDGPSMVEGNTHWNGAMFMAFDHRFKDRYLAAVRSPWS